VVADLFRDKTPQIVHGCVHQFLEKSMGDEFNQIYNSVLKEYRLGGYNYLMRWDGVSEGLNRAKDESKTASRLRPDAELFLEANFSLLILEPIMRHITGSHYGAFDRRAELHEDIRQDMILLLNDASREQGNEPISAHAIVESIARNWSKLRTGMSKKWWSDYGDDE